MSKEIENEKLWNKSYLTLLGANIFSYIGFYLVSPILSEYAVELGASLTVAGVIVGLMAITALFVGPFGGVLTDRTNKKYIMMAGTFINGVSSLGYSLAPNIGVIVFFRILHGASFSITCATGLAWATDFIPKKRLGEGIGYLGIAQIVATACGPSIGIAMANHYGIPRTFMLAALLLLIASIGMFFIKSEQKGFFKKGIVKKKLQFRDIVALEILPLSFIGGLFSMGNGLVTSFLVLMGDERHISGVGLYFTVNAILLLVSRPLSGKIYDRRGLSIILYPGLAFAIVEALLLGHATALWMIVLAAVLKAFGQGTSQPALQAEAFNKLGSERKGVASSTFYIGANIGQGVGPLMGGFLATHFGYTGMFQFSAIMLFCGIIGYYIYTRSMAVQTKEAL